MSLYTKATPIVAYAHTRLCCTESCHMKPSHRRSKVAHLLSRTVPLRLCKLSLVVESSKIGTGKTRILRRVMETCREKRARVNDWSDTYEIRMDREIAGDKESEGINFETTKPSCKESIHTDIQTSTQTAYTNGYTVFRIAYNTITVSHCYTITHIKTVPQYHTITLSPISRQRSYF